MKLSGEINVTLDDKYRITLPAQFRKEMDVTTVVVTKGGEKCIWLSTEAKWDKEYGNYVTELTDAFSLKDRMLRRKYLAPKQDVSIDSAGRILLPESLRKHAMIEKECVVIGLGDYLEIWNTQRYNDFCSGILTDAADEIDEASEELSQRIKRIKGIL